MLVACVGNKRSLRGRDLVKEHKLNFAQYWENKTKSRSKKSYVKCFYIFLLLLYYCMIPILFGIWLNRNRKRYIISRRNYIFPYVSDQTGHVFWQRLYKENTHTQKAPGDCKYMSSFSKKPETAYLLHKSNKVEELYPCQCIVIKYQWSLSQTARCSPINSQCWGWTSY